MVFSSKSEAQWTPNDNSAFENADAVFFGLFNTGVFWCVFGISAECSSLFFVKVVAGLATKCFVKEMFVVTINGGFNQTTTMETHILAQLMVVAMFWDFSSLRQKPCPEGPDGLPRTRSFVTGSITIRIGLNVERIAPSRPVLWSVSQSHLKFWTSLLF